MFFEHVVDLSEKGKVQLQHGFCLKLFIIWYSNKITLIYFLGSQMLLS
mgnify:CR=1 FL=1